MSAEPSGLVPQLPLLVGPDLPRTRTGRPGAEGGPEGHFGRTVTAVEGGRGEGFSAGPAPIRR